MIAGWWLGLIKRCGLSALVGFFWSSLSTLLVLNQRLALQQSTVIDIVSTKVSLSIIHLTLSISNKSISSLFPSICRRPIRIENLVCWDNVWGRRILTLIFQFRYLHRIYESYIIICCEYNTASRSVECSMWLFAYWIQDPFFTRIERDTTEKCTGYLKYLLRAWSRSRRWNLMLPRKSLNNYALADE